MLSVTYPFMIPSFIYPFSIFGSCLPCPRGVSPWAMFSNDSRWKLTTSTILPLTRQLLVSCKNSSTSCCRFVDVNSCIAGAAIFKTPVDRIKRANVTQQRGECPLSAASLAHPKLPSPACDAASFTTSGRSECEGRRLRWPHEEHRLCSSAVVS